MISDFSNSSDGDGNDDEDFVLEQMQQPTLPQQRITKFFTLGEQQTKQHHSLYTIPEF